MGLGVFSPVLPSKSRVDPLESHSDNPLEEEWVYVVFEEWVEQTLEVGAMFLFPPIAEAGADRFPISEQLQKRIASNGGSCDCLQ